MKQSKQRIPAIWLVTLVPLLMAPTNCHGNGPPDAGPPAPPMEMTGGSPSTGGALATGGATVVAGGSQSTGGTSTTASTSTAADACELAGARLTTLNCSQQKTPKGVPFATACHNAVANGLNWHPECIAKVAKCSEVPNAYRGCKP